jgi:membrane protein YqaA with SNARE-associated domain
MKSYFNTKKIIHFLCIAVGVTTLIIASFFFADYVANNAGAQEMVHHLGYVGVLIVAYVTGVNVILPIPPATFVPIFTAAGLLMPFILAAFVTGTLLADLTGYLVGKAGKKFVAAHYPKTHRILQKLRKRHAKLIIPFVFIYTAFIPFPNEAFIIPLGMMGVRVRSIILPLIAGTTVYHMLTIYGTQTIFAHFF